MTIRQVKGGFKLYSEKTGKPLSKVLPTRAAAEKREAQVQMFKHMKGKGKR